MLKALTPNLMVESVRSAVDWYVSVLGFQVETEVPGEEGLVFAIMRRDAVIVMFQARVSLEADLPRLRGEPIAASQTLYVDVDDVEGLRRQVDGKVEILKDLHDTFYGTREFYFTDLNGYILSISQSIS